MKLFYKIENYNDKSYRAYYLGLDNGRLIKIKNVFKNDYDCLKAVAFPLGANNEDK